VQQKYNVDSCVLSVEMPNPYSYGRIVRDSFGRFEKIVEEKDASEQEKSINEINSGIYVFKLPVLWQNLKKILPDNKKQEYYLTDVIKYSATKTTYNSKNYLELKGINTRADLAEVENIVREKLLYNLMLGGVSIYLPQTVYVDYFTKIGQDSIIYPNTILTRTVVKEGCVLGPCSVIENSFIDKGTKIIYSYVSNTRIGKNCRIGPYGRIRPETKILDNVTIGNFVEIKNSVLKRASKINHLSYIGDTELSEEVNIGAGTITCNYDGKKKHRTFIGKKSFIGSNSNLIAPLRIGNNVVVAAGSTISKDVPSHTLAIERSNEVHKKNHRIIRELYK
jgi:bifunctional UDP-N-acetylglucosamine pyrophosphorylase/glucosamine-1-phosphate N-acetyltransferase